VLALDKGSSSGPHASLYAKCYKLALDKEANFVECLSAWISAKGTLVALTLVSVPIALAGTRQRFLFC
jgi:hypothetical protein